MADIKKLTPLILKWEGGYVDHKNDKGGCTNMGVTIGTYRSLINKNATCSDVKNMTKEHFETVLKSFWNRWRANELMNQSVANILVDWVWASGVWGIRIPQRILGVKEDGIVGVKTLANANAICQEGLFNEIKTARIKFVEDIVRNNPSQRVFLKGWINRINDFVYYD